MLDGRGEVPERPSSHFYDNPRFPAAILKSVRRLMPFILFPPIVAEVLDKEPSLTSIWLSHVCVAGLAYCLCRKDWRWLFAFAPLCIFAVWFGTEDLWDKWVGPAILRESRSFFLQWHVAMALVVAAPTIGFWHGFRCRKRQPMDASGPLVQ